MSMLTAKSGTWGNSPSTLRPVSMKTWAAVRPWVSGKCILGESVKYGKGVGKKGKGHHIIQANNRLRENKEKTV